MGIDIHGFIEVRPWPQWPEKPDEIPWEPAIDLDMLYVGRSYDLFGCLFGVTNYAGFAPVAEGRGLPVDVSPAVRARFEEDQERGDAYVRWPTWMSWQDVTGIDWDEPAEQADERVHRDRRDDEGRWVPQFKAPLRVEQQNGPLVPGRTWVEGDIRYRVERLTRRDAVPADSRWAPVWTVMELLSGLHDEYCRLVVWFDG